MTTFSFSTGNPSNLVGGATASMTDLSGSLTDVKTFLNGGNITDTNVSAAGLTDTSLTSPTNAVWRTVSSINGQLDPATITGAGTYYFATSPGAAALSGASSGSIGGLWTPPSASDVAVGSKTTRLRVRVMALTNATSSAVTFNFGVFPITATAGAATVIAPTLGSIIAGSTAALTIAGAGVFTATGASFDMSAVTGASIYCLGMSVSGAPVAGSHTAFQAILEMRHT